ncbi:MAG: hypothetical protein OXU68_01075, partial [Bacteroidota bacterium]|nr:hypothetical protein [Bacteroidota bacterium]
LLTTGFNAFMPLRTILALAHTVNALLSDRKIRVQTGRFCHPERTHSSRECGRGNAARQPVPEVG